MSSLNMNISDTELLRPEAVADTLGVSRQTVAQLLGSRRNISADMAHRLARALGTSADLWMNLQREVDLWKAEKTHRRQYGKIKKISAVAVSAQ